MTEDVPPYRSPAVSKAIPVNTGTHEKKQEDEHTFILLEKCPLISPGLSYDSCCSLARWQQRPQGGKPVLPLALI